jgi:Flp pilus assembly protein TadG
VSCKMSTAFNRMRAFGDSNTGSTAVEFAFVVPLLFLLMFAVIEFGRAWWAKSSYQYAVERAARYAVVCGTGACPSDAAVQTYAANQVYAQSVDSTSFSVTHFPGPPTATCVNYSFNFAPWFAGDMAALQSALTFTGTSCRAHT